MSLCVCVTVDVKALLKTVKYNNMSREGEVTINNIDAIKTFIMSCN